MMKRTALKFLITALIAGLSASGALADTVTYNITATDEVNIFTGSFSFDTTTGTLSMSSSSQRAVWSKIGRRWRSRICFTTFL